MLEILRDILDSMLSAMGSRMINTTDQMTKAAMSQSGLHVAGNSSVCTG